MDHRNRKILNIALPAIVSNITIPLLGLVDTAIIGHLGSAAYLGAIAVGGMIFNVIYWLFGFLRAGTSGFTSQALGANKPEEVTSTLYRSSLFALITAFILMACQIPIRELAFELTKASVEVEHFARIYFNIGIWGAPAILLLYGFNGWFIGMQSTQSCMLISLTQNVINIVLSIVLVFFAKMGIAGVAWGTVAAQYIGLGIALTIWKKRFKAYSRVANWRSVINKRKILNFASVNRDIFLRTICILAVTSFFTTAGARQNNQILASNAVLLQLFYVFSYFMDGFSNAGEALAGRYLGENNQNDFHKTIHSLFKWGFLIAISFTVAYSVGAKSFTRLMTNSLEVIETTKDYLIWSIAIPLTSFAAFLWDGIFIGVTSTKRLFLSMFFATIIFFASYFLLFPIWGNHALWCSFCMFLMSRSVIQTLYFPGISKHLPFSKNISTRNAS